MDSDSSGFLATMELPKLCWKPRAGSDYFNYKGNYFNYKGNYFNYKGNHSFSAGITAHETGNVTPERM